MQVICHLSFVMPGNARVPMARVAHEIASIMKTNDGHC